MIKAVLFDYGGVLSKGGRSVGKDIADALNIPLKKLRYQDLNIQFRRGSITEDEFFDTLNERHNGDGTLRDRLMNNVALYQKEELVYDLAQKLRGKGIVTAVFSNVYKPTAEKLRSLGLYDGFDPIILSCDEGCAKPDIEFYQIAFDRLGLQSQEILLIDDQDKCLIPAKKLGIKTIKSLTAEQVVSDAEELFVQENNITL